jgi:cytidylate kinase
MTIIAISHQLGSGGREIGQRVAHDLGWPYVDNEIVQGVANRLGISEATATAFDEKADHLIDQIFSAYRYDVPLDPTTLVQEPDVDTLTYQQATQGVIETVAASGNVVIAGHGANFYLKDREDLLSIFVFAGPETRAKRLMERDKLNLAEAMKQLHHNDYERAHYIKSLYHADWCDRKFYDLLINTSHLSIETAACLIDQLASPKK